MSQNLLNVILKEVNILRAELKCTICLDLFTEPITLTTCQHTFCFECYKGLFSFKANAKSITCPLCKNLTNRRATYYLNEQIVATVELLKMYEKLVISLDKEGADKDDMYDLTNRMNKFLDDCAMYKNVEKFECTSLSSSDDESADVLMKKEYGNNPKPKVSKTLMRKTKSLNCTKVKGKYQTRQRKTTGDANTNDVIKIDEYESPDVCELEKEENKIVKLIEDDFLTNLENEVQSINKVEEQHNNESKDEKCNKKQKRKHESSFNLNSKSVESNSSKKTATSTGWARMKTMKKQIKKKEVKYKQLNISTEINKSKSKSPPDKRQNLLDLIKESRVVLNRLDSNSDHNLKKNVSEHADTSTHIKIENISTEKLDSILQCLEEDRKLNQHHEEDLYEICTQKLQMKQQKDLDVNEIRSAETIKSNTDTECNIENFIVDVQVHHTSTPVKIIKENKIKEVTVKKNALEQSLKENICDIRDELINSAEFCKVNKRNNKKSSEETDDLIEGTPNSIKKLGTRTSRNLRSASKRISDEHKSVVENEKPPKRRKVTKQNTVNEIIDITSDDNMSKTQEENSITLIEDRRVEETSSKNTILTDQNTIAENKITEEGNILKGQAFVKNELKLFSVQEPIVINALQSSMNAINVVLSQCSNYINSESLFSQSWPSKDSKKSNIGAKPKEKPAFLPDRFLSLPLESNSRSSVDFYGTAIPCLKKIDDFYNQIISLSQQISTETENFKSIVNCTSEECESLVVSFKTKSTKNVEIQTDNIICPECSSVIKFKSTGNITPLEEITVLDGFKEVNNIDNISRDFANENRSQLIQDQCKQVSIVSNYLQSPSIKSIETSPKSSESDILQTKKVNRQLTFSTETNDSQRRKFKRIRSPTPDSDSESVKSKKSNINVSKLLYRDDIDIFFESEPSQGKHNFSLESPSNDNQIKSNSKQYEKLMNTVNKICTPVNSKDSTYISILEREYKDAQFDKISKVQQPIEKQTFDTAPNTVLDNLLGSINLAEFENDNFEPDKKNTDKKTELIASLFTEIEQKNNLIEKKADISILDVLSSSMFLSTEKEVLKNSDVDKTKSIEKLQIHDVANRLADQTAHDKELDQEVENLTTHDLENDSLGSDKDLFGEDIVESTPQKSLESRRRRSRFAFAEMLPDPILDILEPPATVTENLDWIDIVPPPPPVQFQDTENVEEPKLNVQNVSSITPDIFPLNPLDKGFFANSIFLSGTPNQTIKESTQRNVGKESVNTIPNSVTQEKEDIRNDKENLTPKNKGSIPSIPESTIWKNAKRNLNPIVLAQKEKFSPLQIIVNPNTSPKTIISSTPKHQQSILSYVQTPKKENNANEINKNLSKYTTTPVKQNMNNKPNTFVPIKENLLIEVCESPVPQNHLPSTSFINENKVNKSSNENNSSVLEKSKYKYCIAYTRLKKEEILAINSLTQKLNAKCCRDFDKNVTHLIVSVDNQNKIKDHTMKYVLAIAHSVWILSFAWVRDSIEHNQFLPEENYEVLDVCGVPGPKISRLTRLSKPLFKNFIFCCVDPFVSVLRTDIESAVVNLGGEVRKLPSELANSFGKICLILAETKETQDYDQYQVWRDALNVLPVDVEWLSRTIGQYKIISVRPYILCLEKGINDLGYPFTLIAPVPETPSQMTMTNTTH